MVAALSGVIIVLFANRSILRPEIFDMVLVILGSALLLVIGFGFLKPAIDTKLEKKKALIDKLKSCESRIKWTTDDRVKKDEWSYSPDVAYLQFRPELNQEIREYVDRYQRCADLFFACKYVISSEIKKYAIVWLPKTHEKFPLDKVIMDKTEIIHRLINGEKVAKRWIEENFPEIHNNIIKSLQEPEEALDRFFLDLNKEASNNSVLNRFRAEKKNLVELTQSIQESLNREIERLGRWRI